MSLGRDTMLPRLVNYTLPENQGWARRVVGESRTGIVTRLCGPDATGHPIFNLAIVADENDRFDKALLHRVKTVEWAAEVQPGCWNYIVG